MSNIQLYLLMRELTRENVIHLILNIDALNVTGPFKTKEDFAMDLWT